MTEEEERNLIRVVDPGLARYLDRIEELEAIVATCQTHIEHVDNVLRLSEADVNRLTAQRDKVLSVCEQANTASRWERARRDILTVLGATDD